MFYRNDNYILEFNPSFNKHILNRNNLIATQKEMQMFNKNLSVDYLENARKLLCKYFIDS